MKADTEHLPRFEGMRQNEELRLGVDPVRIADRVSHVKPISQASGIWRPCREWPSGQDHRSMFQNRVEPITTLSSARTIANGTALPASRQAKAVSM
jgi:hypothetical protein